MVWHLDPLLLGALVVLAGVGLELGRRLAASAVRLAGRLARRRRTVWVLGRVHSYTGDGAAWSFLGVFADRDEAVGAAEFPEDFVAPAVVGQREPSGRRDWPGAVYPRASDGLGAPREIKGREVSAK